MFTLSGFVAVCPIYLGNPFFSLIMFPLIINSYCPCNGDFRKGECPIYSTAEVCCARFFSRTLLTIRSRISLLYDETDPGYFWKPGKKHSDTWVPLLNLPEGAA